MAIYIFYSHRLFRSYSLLKTVKQSLGYENSFQFPALLYTYFQIVLLVMFTILLHVVCGRTLICTSPLDPRMIKA